MKVLVAGASGFIGKNFILKTPNSWKCVGTYNTSNDFPEFLKCNGLNHVKSVEVEMRDSVCVREKLKKIGNQFDMCVYIMGNSDIGLSRREPLTDVSINIHSLLNLLKNIYVKKFIFMSSGAVYEGYRGLVHPGLSVTPTIPYSVDKLSSELFIRYFQENTDHIENYVNLRFFGAYGPMEVPRKIYTNLINAFVLDNKYTYKILGNGKNFIDAMYIDDAVEALLKITTSDKSNITIDLCCGKPRTVNELVLEVGKIFGRNVELQHEGSAAEYTTFYASPQVMETLFNFRSTVSLSEGMKKFADYLQNQQNQ